MTNQRNIKLTVEYDGSKFHGYQYQDDLRTIQGEIENALLNLTQKEHSTTVAGRTDRGVHATAQVCNFITESKLKLISFLDGLNRFLPEDISIVKVEEVPLDFNARFSAKSRYYEYYLINRRSKSAINSKRVTVYKYPLDIDKMKLAVKYLIGEHDFSSFRAAQCQAKSPITELYSIDFEEVIHLGEKTLKVKIHGRAFLHNMIRIIMGTLIEIGRTNLPPEHMKNVLELKYRPKAGATLAPDGLYFTGVEYSKDLEIFDYEPKEKSCI